MRGHVNFFFGQLLSAFFSFKGQRHTKGSDLNQDLERLPLSGSGAYFQELTWMKIPPQILLSQKLE